MDFQIAAIDLIIMLIYILLTLYIGWRVSKGIKEFEDFAVAGRSFGPFMLAATFGATNFSTWSLVGKPGMVYNSGISVVWIAWNAMACILAAVMFVPIYRKLNYNTMSEIFEDRYDGKLRGLISVIWVIADTLNRYGVTIYAAGVIVGLLLGIPTNYIILIISAVVLFYTYLGGLRSVVITDAIQFVFMWIGLFIGAIFIFNNFGGWDGLVNAIPTELMEWVPAADKATGWPWIIALTLLGFPYFITSQFVMQRGLAAKTVNVAKWGLVFAALLAIPMAIMEIVPGLAAKAILSPDFVSGINPDMIGPVVYMKLLPVGLTGLFFSSLLAAGLSTADSALCGSSSLITEDFYKKWYPNKDEKHYLKVSRISTIILTIIGTTWALLVPKLGGALNAILNVVAITDMPVFVIICLAIFWRKMNAAGAVIAVICATIAGSIVSFTGAGGIQTLALTTLTSTSVALVLGIVVSVVIKRSAVEENRVQAFFNRIVG
ncbi:MAG: solute:Na+ symporter, family [Clostridiales bacterium]|nr:solute:Na+ symporter, family [Clostridiales bacterium]